MSSSYNDFLVSESAAEAEASIRRASFATQVASVMINAAAFTSNILSYGEALGKVLRMHSTSFNLSSELTLSALLVCG